MKLNIEYIKKHYLFLAIKLIIIGLFITTVVRCYNKVYLYSIVNLSPNSGFLDYLKTIIKTSYFRPILVFSIPFIGIFINKKIGWILITSFFYFILSNIIFNVIFEKFIDATDLFTFIFFTTITLLFIGIMNITKVSYLRYKIAKTNLISNNIIASVTRMLITILVNSLK